MWMIAMVALVALTAACGGQPPEEPPPAEEPAEEPAPAETTPAPVIVPEPAEPAEPQEPQLTGNIVEVDSGMDWFNPATRETPGRYWWQVRLRNDTNQTLDITVTFTFLDLNEQEVKTDRKTVRVQPAETGTFRVEDEMVRDVARSVDGYTYSWDWQIVTS
jgi:predicted small lipoprotein YifL